MTFVQSEFAFFLLATLLLYWVGSYVFRHHRSSWQNTVLLLSSLIFYGWVDIRLLGLLAFSSILDYSVGRAIVETPKYKRLWLILSFTGNLSLLFTFKYFDWFFESISHAASYVGLTFHPFTLGLMLPVGISFYTFQTLSYTIDIYKGEIKPQKNIITYASFVCMFPQLVAGPIERAKDLLPQLNKSRRPTLKYFNVGITLMMWGFLQKLMIADNVALYVDRIFSVDHPDAIIIWTGTLGFMVQILADFAGYSNIARGCGYLFGIKLRVNFVRPYLATSPSEFWRHWHVSLSSWFHNYIYIPLGGNRHGRPRWLLTVWVTMLLSGIWHGARWNFVIWGALHALWLSLWKLSPTFTRFTPRIRNIMCWVVMMLIHPFVWLFFREESSEKILSFITQLPYQGSFDAYIVSVMSGSVFAVGALLLMLGGWIQSKKDIERWKGWAPSFWAIAIVLIIIFVRDASRDFIYFRF